MNHEHAPEYANRKHRPTHHAMGQGAHLDMLRAALRRVAGAPAPELDQMQVAMSSEAQIRATAAILAQDFRGDATPSN